MLVPSSDRLRRIVVAIALVAVVAAALSAAGTAAASGSGAVYVNDDGSVEFIDEEGTKNATDQQAAVVGKAVDLNGDGNVEAPVVDNSSTLKLVRPNGTTETLVDGGVATRPIAVNDVDGNGTSDVLYVNSSNENNIWRVSGNGETRELWAEFDSNTKAIAVAGYGDFDGVGTDETVFVDGNEKVRYVHDNGSLGNTTYGDVGTNNKLVSVGPLANYNGSGTPRVAVVGNSNNKIKLIDADGNRKTVVSGGAAIAPIGETDRDGDNTSEVIYVDENSYLKTDEVNDSSQQVVTDDDNNRFNVKTGVGVAGGQGIDLPPPPVSVHAPQDRTYIKYAERVPLNVSARADESVENWKYSIDGVTDGNESFNPDNDTYLNNETVLDPGQQYNLTVYAQDDSNVRTVNRTFGVGESGSAVVYVNDESGNLSYITPGSNKTRVETSVSRDDPKGFVAAGPAIHYDADGQLDIPYVRKGADENKTAPLKLYHVANGSTTTLVDDAMDLGGDAGKISTADFEDDGRFDIVYRGKNDNLRRIDADNSSEQFVDADTTPRGIIGSADVVKGLEGSGGREIVWISGNSKVNAISQGSRTKYDDELSFSETPGTNVGVGAGEPLPIVRGGPKYFPIVDGEEYPGVLNASDTDDYQKLADTKVKKAPVGLADINDDAWKELLFVDKDGEVKYTRANPGRKNNTVKKLGVNNSGGLVTDGGEAIEADGRVGVVATHFAQRVNDYYEYPADDTGPNVTKLELVDTEYEDEVILDVRTDEPIKKWYYSVDGGPEAKFDGPRQLITVDDADLSRGSNTITVRVVDYEGKEDTASETFQVARDDPDEVEAETQPRTATPTPTPTPAATPTPTTVPAATPTPTTTPNTTSTPTTTPTTASTSTTAAPGAEEAGSLNWVFPLLVLVVIAIAVFAVRQRDREE